jgi:GntR family transcriptional regulator
MPEQTTTGGRRNFRTFARFDPVSFGHLRVRPFATLYFRFLFARSMPAIRHSSDQPLYEIVRAGILERLRTGVWTAGDKIPTEPQLAETFGVGIGTIRRAVEELVAERLLIRRAGRGTIVAKFADEHAFDQYFNFVDREGESLKVTAQLLSFAKERATPALASILKLERGARVASVDNLRLRDGVPVMLDHLWIPFDVFPGLTAEAFAARRGSIYGFYQEHFGISVVRVVEDLSGALADATSASALDVAVGAPLLRIERTAYTFKDKPVEHRVRFVESGQCVYRNTRGLQD